MKSSHVDGVNSDQHGISCCNDDRDAEESCHQANCDPEESCHDLRHGSYQQNKRKIIVGLKRIEGQVRGMQRMVEEERYCVDVLDQIAAARMALARIATIVLEDHASGCVTRALLQDEAESREQTVQELIATIKKVLR